MSAARACLVSLLVALTCAVAAQAGTLSSGQIAEQRGDILRRMLSDQYPLNLVEAQRRTCSSGAQPGNVAHDRAQGADFTPDAADECVTALVRIARNNRLPELYVKLISQSGGSPSAASGFPKAAGAVALAGNDRVSIGNGKALVIAPALAFDAGFTVAYQDGKAAQPPDTDKAQLKMLASDCLAERRDVGTCFSVGYVYGSLAFRGWNVAAR